MTRWHILAVFLIGGPTAGLMTLAGTYALKRQWFAATACVATVAAMWLAIITAIPLELRMLHARS